MSLVGDDVLADVEDEDDVHDGPAELTTVHKNFELSDEAPPIPAHTMASMELVEHATSTPNKGNGDKGTVGAKTNGDLLLSTYDVVGAVTESVYEQPAEPPPRCECTSRHFNSE